MQLKPQDILVLLKLVAIGHEDWSYGALAVSLGMSPSEVHAALKRALVAQLGVSENDKIRPIISSLEEFLLHGIRYAFPPERGELSRGIPTAHAAPPLESLFQQGDEPPPVWPDAEGKVRGVSFSPLYKAVPKAVREDAKLYELLALVDAIRGGRARERALAVKELKKRLERY